MKRGFEAVHSEITRLDEGMDSLRNVLRAEMRAVSEKVDGLDERFEVAQRLSIVETKLKDYEEKSKYLVFVLSIIP